MGHFLVLFRHILGLLVSWGSLFMLIFCSAALLVRIIIIIIISSIILDLIFRIVLPLSLWRTLPSLIRMIILLIALLYRVLNVLIVLWAAQFDEFRKKLSILLWIFVLSVSSLRWMIKVVICSICMNGCEGCLFVLYIKITTCLYSLIFIVLILSEVL